MISVIMEIKVEIIVLIVTRVRYGRIRIGRGVGR